MILRVFLGYDGLTAGISLLCFWETNRNMGLLHLVFFSNLNRTLAFQFRFPSGRRGGSREKGNDGKAISDKVNTKNIILSPKPSTCLPALFCDPGEEGGLKKGRFLSALVHNFFGGCVFGYATF